MKNNLLKCFSFMSIFLLFGCGHSIVRTDRGMGFHLRVPNPFQQGDSIVDFKLGNIDTTMAIIRGNTTFDSTSAKGGALTGSGGISERFAISANPQLNEGYIAEILTSPNADKETKIQISKYLTGIKAPSVSDAKTITIGAAAGSGSNSSEITPEKTGIDNIVDKTSDVISEITPTISKATSKTITSISEDVADTAKHTVDTAASTTEKISDSIINHIFLSFIIAILITLIAVFAIEWIVKKIKNKKLEKEAEEEKHSNNENDANVI